jgi:hypothetical protein
VSKHSSLVRINSPDGIGRAAVISNGGKYRYTLSRWWHQPGFSSGMILWIMLNPSTADGSVDDNTIRRCIGFSKLWHYEALTVVNLYAYRATKPADLWARAQTGKDIIGPKNDKWIRKEAYHAQRIMLAWGANADFRRSRDVTEGLLGARRRRLYTLGYTTAGHPLHPLRVRSDTEPVRWEQRAL